MPRNSRTRPHSEQLDEIVTRLEPRFPVAAAMLAEAKADVTAFTGFPVGHWKKIWSTNPLNPSVGNHRFRWTQCTSMLIGLMFRPF